MASADVVRRLGAVARELRLHIIHHVGKPPSGLSTARVVNRLRLACLRCYVCRVTDTSYLALSSDSPRMGKAAEHLVAAFCILASRAVLNVSTSLVDDEGVDLVFHRRGGTATLAVQVKARMSDTKGVSDGRFIAQVQATTFRPRRDLDLLFVAVDVERGALLKAWLVPSVDFAAVVTRTNSKGKYRFSASLKDASRDRWAPYRLEAAELPPAILDRLDMVQHADVPAKG